MMVEIFISEIKLDLNKNIDLNTIKSYSSELVSHCIF